MTTPQDPHKHALYRPHHGDMTGWRYLETGEEIAQGDEWIGKTDLDDCWELYGLLPYVERIQEFDCVAYRRRVASDTKQVKFLTVVVEVRSDAEMDEALSSRGLPIVAYREGNALQRLDQFEDNLKQAVEQVCRGEAK